MFLSSVPQKPENVTKNQAVFVPFMPSKPMGFDMIHPWIVEFTLQFERFISIINF